MRGPREAGENMKSHNGTTPSTPSTRRSKAIEGGGIGRTCALNTVLNRAYRREDKRRERHGWAECVDCQVKQIGVDCRQEGK